MDLHPKPSEPDTCVASPSNAQLTEDYAVIAFMPGLNAGRSIMILAGTTTFGTQRVVEFVSRENAVQTLLSGLAVAKPSDLRPFEALVRVKVARGVPVETELVALHQRGTK